MGQNQSKRGNKKKASKTVLPFKPISFWSKSGIFLFCQSKESLWRFGMTWWMGPDKKREIAFEIQFSTLSSRRCNAGQPKTNPWSLHCIGTKDLIDMLSLARPPVALHLSISTLQAKRKKIYFQSWMRGCLSLTLRWWTRRTATRLGAGPPQRTEALSPPRERQSASRNRTVWTRTW